MVAAVEQEETTKWQAQELLLTAVLVAAAAAALVVCFPSRPISVVVSLLPLLAFPLVPLGQLLP